MARSVDVQNPLSEGKDDATHHTGGNGGDGPLLGAELHAHMGLHLHFEFGWPGQ
jgi:hypothetical protein